MSGDSNLAVRGFRAVEWVSPRVSYRTGRAAARWAGEALYRLAPGARRNVEANLGRVLGQQPGTRVLEAAVREACRSYCLYWFETFHLRGMSRARLAELTDFAGEEHIRTALDAGRGAILALPHMGNWDAGGHWVTAHGYAMTAVAEELQPPAAYRLFRDHRKALGMGIVGLGDARVGEELIGVLAANQMLCLVADRDLSGRGVDVEMFGGRTQMPAGPAMLSLTSGAPLLPATVHHRETGGWEVHVAPALQIERTDGFRDDVTSLTRALAATFERVISASPTDWHMFQPYWPA